MGRDVAMQCYYRLSGGVDALPYTHFIRAVSIAVINMNTTFDLKGEGVTYECTLVWRTKWHYGRASARVIRRIFCAPQYGLDRMAFTPYLDIDDSFTIDSKPPYARYSLNADADTITNTQITTWEEMNDIAHIAKFG